MKKTFIYILCFLGISFQAEALLQTPVLTAPLDGSVNRNPDQIIDWSNVTGATEYEYRFGMDSLLAGSIIQTTVGSSASNTNLLFGTTYYWQVRAIKSSAPVDSSAWTQIFKFTVANKLTLINPPDSSYNIPLIATLDWAALTGVSAYDVDMDTTPNFTSNLGLIDVVYITSGYATTFPLQFSATYYWRVRARHAADTSDWSDTRRFTVVGYVTLISPLDGDTIEEISLYLDWNATLGAIDYNYQLDTSSAFNSPVLLSGQTFSLTQVYITYFPYGTTYYWRVRSMSASDTSQWSQVWTFTTSDEVLLQSPVNNAVNQPPSFFVQWYYISGSPTYNFQLDTSANFNSALLYDTVAPAMPLLLNNLRFGATYYWRVRAMHPFDTSGWSQTWNFSTLNQIPVLFAPPNGSTNNTTIVFLNWLSLNGATFYDCEWDTSVNFSSPIKYDTTTTLGGVQTNILQFGITYYWHVRARHAADTSDWSQIWSFTTAATVSMDENKATGDFIKTIYQDDNSVYIEFDSRYENLLTLNMIDQQGRSIYKNTFSGNNTLTINKDGITHGLYVLRLSSAIHHHQRKLFVY